MFWQTSRRKISLEEPLVMAILNVTPDSFSDGGDFFSVYGALRHAERIVADGADIIDIGGESTRPGSTLVAAEEEIRRTIPVIEAIVKRFDLPISIDTTKSEVARMAVDAGAEIINDISGLRFDEQIANVASGSNTGLIIMHSRGSFETMHTHPPANDIFADVREDFRRAVGIATAHGVSNEQIALDIGIGFGKTQGQNLELLAKLDNIVNEYEAYPMLVGVSRKSFIGKIHGNSAEANRLGGSLAAAMIAVANGARIIRAHDVFATVQAIRVTTAIRGASKQR